MFGKQDKKIKAILRFSGDVSITGIAKEIENELSIHTPKAKSLKLHRHVSKVRKLHNAWYKV